MESWEVLERHPFTLIGLSDREKFHTGMIAFMIRYFWEHEVDDFRLNLIEVLWKKEGLLQEEFKQRERIDVRVEQGNIDLLVMVGNQVRAFAEIKFKTTLHGNQLDSYQQKHPESPAVVLGLFQEETNEHVPAVSFPDKVTTFFERHSGALLDGQNDSLALLLLWIEYLS